MWPWWACPGKFELANESTLFLDEIDGLSFNMQAKLLRALQEGQVDRIGSEKPVLVDVRIIAATNKRMADLLEEGKFRKDLYFRLNVIKKDGQWLQASLPAIHGPEQRSRELALLISCNHYFG